MAKPPESTVLFLSAATDFRSRFAVALFEAVARKFGLPWTATARRLPGGAEPGKSSAAAFPLGALEILSAAGFRGNASPPLPPEAAEADLAGASRVVLLNGPEDVPRLRAAFPQQADRCETWQAAASPHAFALVQREVAGLVARIIGGGERTEPDLTEPAPAPKPGGPKKPMQVKVGRETAGRRGKGVTTVFDTPLDAAALEELGGLLKARCGTGGTVKDGRIEIQGDQRDRITAELEKLGYRVKRAGG